MKKINRNTHTHKNTMWRNKNKICVEERGRKKNARHIWIKKTPIRSIQFRLNLWQLNKSKHNEQKNVSFWKWRSNEWESTPEKKKKLTNRIANTIFATALVIGYYHLNGMPCNGLQVSECYIWAKERFERNKFLKKMERKQFIYSDCTMNKKRATAKW